MKTKINDWKIASFIIGYHALLVVGLPLYLINYSPSWKLWVIGAVLLYAAGLGITAGYHRLYSHLTYKTNPWVEAVYLFFASLATQGSALKWSFDHRNHHAFVDTEKDPYSIKKGFMFAHVLWLFGKTPAIEKKVVADLYKNPLVMFQHKHYNLCMLSSNLLTTLVVGYFMNDYLGAFMITWLVRLFLLHHFTWFINSLAHTWGSKSFSKEHSAVDNYCISLLTFGEGYHNYHHTFAVDYRNGVKWYHFDPTKWLIWTLSKLKLARGLKKANLLQVQRKMILEGKEELLEKLKNYWNENTSHWEATLEKVSTEILNKFNHFQELASQYRDVKKQEIQDQELIKKLKDELSSLHISIQEDWRNWKKLSKTILHLKPDSLHV